ncbi:hypothetical protein Tco_0474370 [Tanacetum coccineum]
MHNNIMAVGSRDRPLMLATGRYAHWQSRFLRYIDTRLDGDALRKYILQAVETLLNMSHENKAHYQSEKEAIHLLLTRIGDEIYSTIDACKTAHDMWIATERLQQGESLNIQDVKTNLFWEFGRFTSHDEEIMESYYSRFYKIMNEMIKNNLTVATMQVNVQFLQQLQPEWSRFVTIVKQNHDLDTVSYHKLFDILKQCQKEVNEIHAERIAKNANLLALVVAAQQYPGPYYQPPKSHKSYAPQSKQSSSTRYHASTRYKGVGPLESDIRAQELNPTKGKEIAKPITPPSESASEEDIDLEQAQRDKDMQQTWNSLQKQADWLEDTDEEIDEQELEAHYNYMAKIQEVPTADSGTDSEPFEKTDQNVEECDDERVALATLIVNLKLTIDENKKIRKKLKKVNTSLTQELKECKSTLEETNSTPRESNSTRDSYLIALQDKQTELKMYKTLNDCCNTPKNVSQRKYIWECYFIIQQHKIQENDL